MQLNKSKSSLLNLRTLVKYRKIQTQQLNKENMIIKLKSLLAMFAIVLTNFTFGQSVPSYVPINELVGWYPFNGNAADESSNMNNGVVNGPTLSNDRFGQPNKAYNFDGVNDYINIGNPTKLSNPPIRFTQSVWIKLIDWPNSSSIFNVYPIISKRHQNNGNDWATARIQIDGKCYFFADDAFHENYIPAISPIISINTWQHFVFVKDSNNYKIFMNGILVSSIIENHTMSGSNNDIYIGAHLAWNSYFKGSLDDIGIWNRALTETEISNLYKGCMLEINIHPINQTIKANTNAKFIIGTNDSSANYIWQTDIGLGFQNLNNAGQYSGTQNDTLIISNANLANNNQIFRCIVSKGACKDTSNIALLNVTENVGLIEKQHVYLIQVFPNPAQNELTIKSNNLINNTKYSISDNTGRIVLTGTLNELNTNIKLTGLYSGLYTLLIDDTLKQTIRIIKY